MSFKLYLSKDIYFFSVSFCYEVICICVQTTPLSVAYLKGHFGIVSQLLDHENVNVNHPDEEGERTNVMS